ncbi:MAG TPA: serine/threonine-protein kinase, partial [Vicinamibacterales bacterium]|nr:serine/threonine-protein kinase [Vicinamibacterales bacterium]
DEYDEDFLESVLTVSDTLDSTNAADEAGQLPDIHAGDQIGPYVVLDRLGAGGMGHVFLGNDTRLQRKVALKCLIASASAGELRSRILHEARSAARIMHPNIAIVHDVVEHEDRPFLVMEYVEGESLAALIKRERPPIDRIVTMVRQLASALAAAHAKGIVHRDLKPANIQVTPDGSVKVLDFGVAHAMSAAAGMTGAATQPGLQSAGLTVPMATSTLQADRRVMHPGTPAYMSPEQMFGRAIDQRSDIYSLGVIVYEMATGHRPYATDDPLEVVLTLSRDFLRGGDQPDTLPAQINDVVAKMLAVRPEDRYQTAGELENALIALTARASVAAPAVASVSWAKRLARAAVVVISVPLIAGALGLWTTAIFNFAMQRPREFSAESPMVSLEMGARSTFAPAVFIIAVLFVLSAARFGVRLVSLSRRVDSLLTASRSRTKALSSRLNFDNPTVAGQAAIAVAIVALGFVIWRYMNVLDAVFTFMSTKASLQQVLPTLRPPHNDAIRFRFALEMLMVGLVVALAKVAGLRSRQTVRAGGGAIAMLCVLLLTTVLLAEAPYRLFWHADFERVTAGSERCYAIGETAARYLLFCPDAKAPRNRVVPRDGEGVVPTGTRENIFTPPDTSH